MSLSRTEREKDVTEKSAAARWKEEYDKQGIPSSFRTEPSGAVKEFFYPFFLQNSPVQRRGRAIDMGCGLGRNSLFFAEQQGFEVIALDLVADNIERLQKQADERGLKIKAICGDITDRIPAEDSSIDVIIDVFCYKHQLDDRRKENYRKEVARVLKSNGYYLLSLAGKDDGYYGQFLKEGNDQIVDPVINVGSQLYDIDDIKHEFAGYKILQTQTTRKPGMMHGNEYDRVTHAFIMSKGEETIAYKI